MVTESTLLLRLRLLLGTICELAQFINCTAQSVNSQNAKQFINCTYVVLTWQGRDTTCTLRFVDQLLFGSRDFLVAV